MKFMQKTVSELISYHSDINSLHVTQKINREDLKNFAEFLVGLILGKSAVKT
jgi:hypothetical protein